VPFRLVSWNLNHWRQPTLPIDTRRDAWAYLQTIEARAALVQEAVPPVELAGRSVYGEIGGHRNWGSAVVALDDAITIEPLRSVRLPYSRRRYVLDATGPVAVARVTVPGIEPIVLVSVYGLWDGPVVSNVLRAVADLVPLFDSPYGARVILGGDLNISTAGTDPKARSRAEAVLAAVRSLGLVEAKSVAAQRPSPRLDCPCGGPECGHLATWGPDEIDHLFVSPALADQVVAVSIDPEVVASGLSDHVPLVLDLALDSRPTPHVWDEEAFAEEIGRRHGPAAREVVAKLVNWADQKERELAAATGVRTKGLTRFPMNGITTEPELWFQLDLDMEPRGTQGMISIRASGDVVVQFGGMRHPPFDSEARRNELRVMLNGIDGVEIPDSRLRWYPRFPLTALRTSQALGLLAQVLNEVASRSVGRQPACAAGEPSSTT